VLSGEVLLNSSEETLSEEESRDPIAWWLSLINPVIDELKSLNEINDVGC